MDRSNQPDQAGQPNVIYSYLMMLGHTCCDMNQSTVPALLPFLIAQRGIDYAAAAGLVFANSFLSSLIQPLLGLIADKKQMPWLMGTGIVMTGLGIGAIGFLDSYWGIFAVIMISGFGSALFHPEGGRMANCVAGEKKGRSMSTFAAGGNLGYVIGPVVATFSVTAWGLRGTAVVLIPTAITAAIFFCMEKKFVQLSNAERIETGQRLTQSGQQDDWPAFFWLSVPIFMRSIVQTGLQTFIPLYWVGVLMQTQQHGSLMVTVLACASTVAAFTGGRLADRYGFRRVIRLSFSAMAPLLLLALTTRNVWVATALVVPLAAATQLNYGPSVVLGQKYLPNRLGLASGVTIGLSVSVGGICSPLLGRIGDQHGLTTAMYVLAAAAMVGFLGTLRIKEPVVLEPDAAPHHT